MLSEADRAARAVGIDRSRAQLDLASEAVPTAALLQGDVTRLPVDDGVFDAVVPY